MKTTTLTGVSRMAASSTGARQLRRIDRSVHPENHTNNGVTVKFYSRCVVSDALPVDRRLS